MSYDKRVQEYEQIRQRYRPQHIKVLLIAESPPPGANTPSSRHFYRTPAAGSDRLFLSTMRAILRKPRSFLTKIWRFKKSYGYNVFRRRDGI